MSHEQASGKNKAVATFIVIMAVVIVTVGVHAINKPANKAASTATTATTPSTAGNPSNTATNSPATSSTSANFKDGTYTASSNYETPGGTEGITATVTVQNNTVTNSSIKQSSNNRDSQAYQNDFAATYQQFVIGKKLNTIDAAQMSGSSLTAQGFENALQQVEQQAQTS